jgi:hypothetical protein
MTYTITWHRENRVLYMKLEGEVAGEELVKMEAEAFEIIQKASGMIHAIVDMRDIANQSTLNSSFSNMNRHKHPNQGISVIVLPHINRVAKFITSTMMQVLRLQFRICETIEEAEAIIDKVDVRVV